MPPASSLDFGYPWWLTHGHWLVLVPAVAAWIAAYMRGWPRWTLAVLGVLALWAGASLFVLREFRVNGRAELPAREFLASGEGRVLDMGAGTGRSSIMVLEARPRATLVALDLFGASFERHFGPGASPRERLMANLKAAGVDRRAAIETADMRQLPFAPASFDAIVSAYAIDHLDADGIRRALAEAARVVKPGGDFLLILVANDRWVRFAFGPLLSHGPTRGAAWWSARVREAGFEIAGQGTRPATLFFLARRK